MKNKKDYIITKIKTEHNFADEIYKKYRTEKYGIGSCCSANLPSYIIDKYLCDWQDRTKTVYTSITLELLELYVYPVCNVCGPIPIIYGCTDPTAMNYDPTATVDNDSCIYCVYGCTDIDAMNYDSLATCDDGSCCYACVEIPVPNGNLPDGIDGDTVNASSTVTNIAGFLPQAYIDSAYTTFAPNTWYRFSGTASQIYESSNNFFGSTETGIVQKLSGLIVGATYEFVITLSSTSGSTTFYQYVDNNLIQSTIIPAGSGTGNVQFVAQTPSDTFVFKASGYMFAFSMFIDGVGTYPSGIPGCCDPNATNYDPDATCDDGSCNYN
jgi:hypothetical protein